MSKATTLIEGEHREIERLFDRFKKAPTKGAAMGLCQLLQRHTEMEEAILYPELEQVDQELFEDAKQEHEEADELIEQIRTSADPEHIAALVSELEGKVSHHVNDEETEDLPRMEEVCGGSRMDELGAQMQHWKEQRTDGGQGSEGRADLLDLTKEELYEKAQQADIEGRSDMTKEELAEALSKR